MLEWDLYCPYSHYPKIGYTQYGLEVPVQRPNISRCPLTTFGTIGDLQAAYAGGEPGNTTTRQKRYAENDARQVIPWGKFLLG